MGRRGRGLVEEARLFELVRLVYAAAVDASARGAFVYALCRALGLEVSHRHVLSTEDAVLDICHNDPSSVDRYFPVAQVAQEEVLPQGGRLRTVEGALPQAALIGSAFFDEWLRPPHEDCGALVLLERSGEAYDFGLFYRPLGGVVPGPLQEMLDVLRPHCLAVAELMRVTQRLELERQAMATALDEAPFGLLLLDGEGVVTECNRAAQAVLEGEAGLRLGRGRRLEAALRHEQGGLEALVGRAQALARGRAVEAAGGMGLGRPERSSRLEVVGVPLVQRGSSALSGGGEVAVFMRDPATDASGDVSYEPTFGCHEERP